MPHFSHQLDVELPFRGWRTLASPQPVATADCLVKCEELSVGVGSVLVSVLLRFSDKDQSSKILSSNEIQNGCPIPSSGLEIWMYKTQKTLKSRYVKPPLKPSSQEP